MANIISKKIRDKFINCKEARNAIWLISGRVIQMVISFFVSVLTARYLGPSNYGIINYAGAYVAFFSSLCTLGINYVIIKDFVDSSNEQGTTLGTSLILRIVSGLCSILMTVGIVSIVDKGDYTILVVVTLSSVALIFQAFDTINYWFQFHYQSKVTAIATLVAYIITATYRIILLITEKNVFWFAFASSVDYICIGLFLLVAYKRYNGPKWTFSYKKAKTLLGRSYHYILSGLMIVIYTQTDKLMLKQMLDDVEVGYYSLATTVNLMWVFVLQAIIDSMYPTILRTYKEDKELFNKKNRQLYAFVIYISVIVALCFVVFGKYVIYCLYGEAFMDSVAPLRIVAWFTIFSYLGVARNAWIVCENKQRYLKYMYFTAALLNITLNYIMIPIAGTSGAALASLITQVCTSIVIPCFIRELRPNVKLMMEAFVLKDIK